MKGGTKLPFPDHAPIRNPRRRTVGLHAARAARSSRQHLCLYPRRIACVRTHVHRRDGHQGPHQRLCVRSRRTTARSSPRTPCPVIARRFQYCSTRSVLFRCSPRCVAVGSAEHARTFHRQRGDLAERSRNAPLRAGNMAINGRRVRRCRQGCDCLWLQIDRYAPLDTTAPTRTPAHLSIPGIATRSQIRRRCIRMRP
jgi:hypothetical protein